MEENVIRHHNIIIRERLIIKAKGANNLENPNLKGSIEIMN